MFYHSTSQKGGGGCNVMATEDLAKREVIFELSRDVVKGEELFMDYGLTYDRSNYG
jgi:SET domain-containing protein